MSTNASIWKKNENGTFTGIYVHFDGYITDGVGEMLQTHYQDPEKVDKLIALGGISYLEKNVDAPKGHTFNTPVPEVTVAYHRDRHEPFRQLHAKDFYGTHVQLFNYYFINNTWYVDSNKSDNTEDELIPLADALNSEATEN